MNWVLYKHRISLHFVLSFVDVVPDIPCVVVNDLPCVVFVAIIAVVLDFSSDVGSVVVIVLTPS
jgi:hypothetical protein